MKREGDQTHSDINPTPAAASSAGRKKPANAKPAKRLVATDVERSIPTQVSSSDKAAARKRPPKSGTPRARKTIASVADDSRVAAGLDEPDTTGSVTEASRSEIDRQDTATPDISTESPALAMSLSEPASLDRASVESESIESAIRQRAYEIYLSRGNAAGNVFTDWLAAESQVRLLRRDMAGPAGHVGRID